MRYQLIQGNVFDVLPSIPAESIDLVITSPPYWGLRSYGVEGELGAEPTMEAYLENLMRWVKEVYRILKPSGSFVLNIGDCYLGGGRGTEETRANGKLKGEGFAGGQKGGVESPKVRGGFYKPKQLLSVSSFAYCKIVSETDFVCRNESIWCKPNVPSPIRSRLKHSHEKVFWFVKDADEYYFNAKPWLRKVTQNSHERGKYPVNMAHFNTGAQDKETKAPVEYPIETIEHSWRVVPVGEKQKGFELNGKEKQEHVAPFPEALVKPWVESLCPPEGVVLDPFMGSGTVLKIARDLRLNCVGIELNPKYVEYAAKRCNFSEEGKVSGNTFEIQEFMLRQKSQLDLTDEGS